MKAKGERRCSLLEEGSETKSCRERGWCRERKMKYSFFLIPLKNGTLRKWNTELTDSINKFPYIKRPECEDDTHTPKMGAWESSRTPKTSKFNCRGQNTLIEAFFISLEIYQNVSVKNGLAWAIWTSIARVMAKRRVGNQMAVWLATIKSQESTQPWCV
jgi:hypothetical protein